MSTTYGPRSRAPRGAGPPTGFLPARGGPPSPRTRDHRVEHVAEAIPIGRFPDHELRQRVARVEQRKTPIRDGGRDGIIFQATEKPLGVLGGGDHDDGVAVLEAGREEPADGVEQVLVLLVELNDVTVGWAGEQRCERVRHTPVSVKAA
jgi:hypothetical protein